MPKCLRKSPSVRYFYNWKKFKPVILPWFFLQNYILLLTRVFFFEWNNANSQLDITELKPLCEARQCHLVILPGFWAFLTGISLHRWKRHYRLVSEIVNAKHQNIITYGLFTQSISVNVAIKLAILFSLKTMESLKNGLQPYSGATQLFSIRIISLASSQSCRSIDADASCKWPLGVVIFS